MVVLLMIDIFCQDLHEVLPVQGIGIGTKNFKNFKPSWPRRVASTFCMVHCIEPALRP
jgi:hypothetical protein